MGDDDSYLPWLGDAQNVIDLVQDKLPEGKQAEVEVVKPKDGKRVVCISIKSKDPL